MATDIKKTILQVVKFGENTEKGDKSKVLKVGDSKNVEIIIINKVSI